MNENEKVYKSMGFGGVTALVAGIVILCVGLVVGVLLMVSGGKLMSDKNDLTF